MARIVTLADFGIASFADASASTAWGTVGPYDAKIYEILQNKTVVSSVSVTDSGVMVTYI